MYNLIRRVVNYIVKNKLLSMENKLDGKYKFTPPSVGSGDGVQWNGVSFDRWHL